MARFYSNENLPIALVKSLRDFNHNVLTSLEAGNANQGIPDEEVLAYANANDRIVITLNRDDFIALHRSGINHCGIVNGGIRNEIISIFILFREIVEL
jgi:predicted nuclease of predicted toxin-antitoxin system